MQHLKPLALIGLFVVAGAIIAKPLSAEEFTPTYNPTLEVSPVEGEIKVDGDLSDPGWRNAARADDFAETNPGNQIKPGVESAALMTFDESNLYIALIAYDDPNTIRVSMSDRDNIFRDDYFGIMFDTYGDATWGYEIFVNPIGLQGDLRVLSSGNEDMSLDLVFESKGIVTDSGYQVEIAIPFASIRFPNKEEQTWNVNFWRDRQRENRYRYSWAAQNRDEPCWICRWGKVTGIKNISPSSNIDVLPNIIGSQSGELLNFGESDQNFDNENVDGEASLNIRYGVTSSSSLELAVNPDFSQVESDAGQIDVNTPFALFFPERRPFFQEGSDLFGSFVDVIYTRTVNDPDQAVKFTGQFGRTSMAYLFAADNKSPLTVPLMEQSRSFLLDNSISNILKVRQSFGGRNELNFVLTDRRTENFTDPDEGIKVGKGSGTNYGVDGTFKLWGAQQFEFQVVGSYTEEPDAPDLIDTSQADGLAQKTFDSGKRTVALDGEKFSGHALYASFERNADQWWVNLDWWEYSPTFRTDNGFTNSNDSRTLSFESGLFFRPNKEWLVSWGPWIGIGRIWSFDGKIDLNPANFDDGAEDEWVRTAVNVDLKGQTNIFLSYLQSRERFSGFVFPGISRGTFEISSRPTEFISGGFNVSYGNSIRRRRFRRYEDSGNPGEFIVRQPELGVETNLFVWSNMKLTQRLRVEPTLDYAKMDHRDNYFDSRPDEDPEADRNIFSGYILRTRVNYQFTRELFIRLIVQYNDFSDRVAVEPLLTYRINPFTVFFIGMNNNYQQFQAGDHDHLASDVWELDQRQFFAKFQYLIRI